MLSSSVEQFVAFMPFRVAWALTMPRHLAPVLPVTAALFVIGRQLFLGGYPAGARGRLFGFGLGFHPHVIMCGWLLGHLAGWV